MRKQKHDELAAATGTPPQAGEPQMKADLDPTDLRVVFAENLRLMRRERGLTQNELAEKSGVGRIYIWQLEHCVYHASLKVIERLAAALEVEPSELLKPAVRVDAK